ncbi:MAG: GNAT family N-acetyltransferase [Phycisphaerales bacterium]|nr:GNAT family N-acetyltransferase [Phycisphaerales bacterium]
MTNTAIQRHTTSAIAIPDPRQAISIRTAVETDLAFIDALQREHSRAVGWFPRQQLEGNIRKGQVLIAEAADGVTGCRGEGVTELQRESEASPGHPLTHSPTQAQPLAYCISADRYFKRDDCGIIYQLNVAPGHQRGLIGASLIKAVFDRAPYGCKLFCCWCAQDLEANCFWESLGFVPLAFRTGARRGGAKKDPRIHIFWQRRIREGDAETPYWYPSETTGGAVRENRIALPIPPGTHWSDAKPAVLPGVEEMINALPSGEVEKRTRQRGGVKSKPAAKPRAVSRGGLWFAPVLSAEEIKAKKDAEAAQSKARKAEQARTRRRNDPKLVAAARELRDRYIEQINEGRLLPPGACGKYEVSRALEGAPSALKGERVVGHRRLLDAA